MSHEDEARTLYMKLHTPNHYLDKIDITIIAAALRTARQQVWEEAAKMAENPTNWDRIGGSTGNAAGTGIWLASLYRQAAKETP